MRHTNFNHLKTHFSQTCQQLIKDHDILLVTQDNAENLVIMPQSLFDSWQETKSPIYKQETSLKKLLASWSPLEEEFPEIEDLPAIAEDIF
jgi:PHD/YefM family antitoxin component YafN of YafNO toxin-antitoxin module